MLMQFYSMPGGYLSPHLARATPFNIKEKNEKRVELAIKN